MGMAKSQSALCSDEAARKEASAIGMLKLDFTGAWSAKIMEWSQNGCLGGRVSGIAPKDVDQSVKYDCKKTLSEQVHCASRQDVVLDGECARR